MTQRTDRNAQDARIERDDIRLQIADAQFLTVFLSLHGEERAARWRMLDSGAKFRLVARQLTALGYEWTDALVAGQIVKYDAKYAAGPVEAAVEGALERLALEHASAARLADQAGDLPHRKAERAAATAFTNALREYRKGVRAALLPSGNWLLPSSSGGRPHIVRMDGDWMCNCDAGANMHWPIALVIAIEVAQDAMREYDDGAPDSELAAALERTSEALARMQAAQRLAARICAARGRSQWAA